MKENVFMNNTLETRVSTLEEVALKLAQSSAITNEVINCLTLRSEKQIRDRIRIELSAQKQELESNITTSVAGQIDTKVQAAVKETLDERGLSKADADKLESARYKRMRELLGDSKSDQYQLFIPFYQGCMRKGYQAKFQVKRYADISPNEFRAALEYIQNFTLSDTSWCVKALHDTYAKDEFRTPKLRHAYERYFQITQ